MSLGKRGANIWRDGRAAYGTCLESRWWKRHRGSNPLPSASFNSGVVQLVERRTVNPYVTGSSPVTGAKVYLSRWACPRGRRGRTANPISASTREFESHRPLQVTQGAIAQLGERLHGMQEVRGSTPLGSTICDFLRWRWLHAHGRAEHAAYPPYRTHERPVSSEILAATALHYGTQESFTTQYPHHGACTAEYRGEACDRRGVTTSAWIR